MKPAASVVRELEGLLITAVRMLEDCDDDLDEKTDDHVNRIARLVCRARNEVHEYLMGRHETKERKAN
jgi:hypothetical protein